MESKAVSPLILKETLESEDFKTLLKSVVDSALLNVCERLDNVESKLKKLGNQRKNEEENKCEQEKKIPPKTPRMQLEISLKFGLHGLDEKVVNDFSSTKLKFIEFEPEDKIINSITYSQLFDEIFHTFSQSKRDFYTTNNSSQMRGFIQFTDAQHNFSENETFQMVEIKMRVHVLLHIFLPKTRFGLENALNNLGDGEQLYHLITTAKDKYVNIRLPRFAINTETDLGSFVKSIEFDKELYDIVSKNYSEKTPNFVHKAKFELTFVNNNRLGDIDDKGYDGLVDYPYEIIDRVYSGPKLEFLADHPF